MFKKLSDKFSKGIIYLAAFLVTALMAVMMIHIVKESIHAISQLGIKMFRHYQVFRPSPLMGITSPRKVGSGSYMHLPISLARASTSRRSLMVCPR